MSVASYIVRQDGHEVAFEPMHGRHEALDDLSRKWGATHPQEE